MKQGNFSGLAEDYTNRPGYSLLALNNLSSYVGAHQKDFVIADIGAGTGKLNENLLELSCKNIIAVEPNDDMRAEGIKITGNKGVKWVAGSGEETNLEGESVNWVLMASSFHWTDPQRSLPEFKRILKPGGFLTVLWNPRDLENNLLQKKIDEIIYQISPEITRVSSGSVKYTEGIEKTLVSAGDFANVIFVESLHEVIMSKERYMGAWRSVNDIQAQVGPEKFKEILKAIEKKIQNLPEIIVSYKTRSWTSQVIK